MSISDSSSLESTKLQALLPWQIFLLAWILGLLAAKYFAAALMGGILLFIFQRLPLKRLPALLLLGLFFIAGLTLSSWLLPSGPPAASKWMQEGKEVWLQAKVERVRGKPQKRLRIILGDVRVQIPGEGREKLASKLVWTWLRPTFRPAPGQTVRGHFKIKPVHGYANPGAWNSEFYWATKGVGYRTFTKEEQEDLESSGKDGLFWDLREKVRQSFLSSVKPGQGSALLQALLLGDKFNLDYATIELVRRASLAHTLALSGLHLGFVASLGWILAWLAGKVHAPIYLYLPRPKLAVFLAAPLVLGYMWLGQASFSLLRAGLMFFFWGLLLLFDRRSILLDGLFAALAVIIICSPLSVFDLGLQFSAVAVSGIVLLGPLLYAYYSKWAEDKRWKCWLKVPLIILGISFIANLALLPLLVNSFGRVSPHLYLNLFWLPLLGWLVLPLGLLGLAFLFVPGLGLLGELLLQGSAGTLELMLAGLGCLDSWGLLNVFVPLRPLWPQAIGYWLLLGLTVLYLYQKKRFSWLLLALGTLLLLAPGVYREVSSLKSKVSLKMLDVGQGQALLIELPRGKRLLIDGGGSWNPDYDLGKYVLAPALTGGKGPMLEQMVLTHADYDHYRGLYYPLRHFAVQEFAFNGQWPPKLEGKKMRRLLEEKDIRTQTWFKGKKIELGRQLFLEVLHPQAGVKYAEENNNSLVFRLVYKHQGLALLPGDIEASALQSLLASGQELRAQVLVLPHHGSRTSFSPEFYQRVQPRLALASAGYLHFFNLPHDQVCEELQRQNVPLYTTAEHGAVTVSWRLNELKPKLGTER